VPGVSLHSAVPLGQVPQQAQSNVEELVWRVSSIQSHVRWLATVQA